MKITICLLMVVYVVAEPPVDNRYLPPQQGYSGNSAPSREYGVPGLGNSRQGNGFRRPSTSYGTPSRTPQNNYLPPSARRSNTQFTPRAPQNNYLPPTRGNQFQSQYQSQPSTQYGAPNSQPSTQYGAPNSQPSTQYGAPNAQPSTQYGAPNAQPSTQYGAPNAQPSTQYGAPNAQPSTQYGAPNAQPSTQYGVPNARFNGGLTAPSQDYGVPGFGRGNELSRPDITSANFAQSRQYLPPGRGGYDDGSNGEPANYSFEYMVKDEPSGNDFGHRESRQGDRAEGLYYVLLPDGRKQTVEYEADQDGFKPRISYEDTGVRTDYNRNSQGYDDQYSEGGY